MSGEENPEEVLFEIRRVGDSLRVAAVDGASGVEVVVTGPAAAGPLPLQRLALRKLARALQQGRAR